MRHGLNVFVPQFKISFEVKKNLINFMIKIGSTKPNKKKTYFSHKKKYIIDYLRVVKI